MTNSPRPLHVKYTLLKPAHYFPPHLTPASVLALSMAFGTQTTYANLNNVPGLNGVQTATAAAVMTVCPQMVALNNDGLLNATEQALLTRCGELVFTAIAQQGGTPPAPELVLDLSESELRDAIQDIAPEETEIMGAGATETSQDQLNNLGNRMQALRSGTSIATTSGISWNLDGQSGGAAGNDSFSRTGMYINGLYGDGKRDASTEQNGFNYDAYGLTLGLDHRYSNTLVAGVALGVSNSDVDISNNAGNYDTDGYNLSLYSTWYSDQFYLEGILTYGAYDYEGTRHFEYATVNQTIKLDTEGEQLSYSLATGYNGNQRKFSYHLFGRLAGVEADLDSYDETGSELSMHVNSQEIESLQFIIGGQLSYNSSQDYGVIIPYMSWEQHHEFDDEARDITARYVFDPTNTSFSFKTETADKNFSIVSVGTSLLLKGGNQLFMNVDKILNLENVESKTFMLGLRIEL